MTENSTPSRSSIRRWRGQTEPIAALAAIAVVVLAVGLYGGYVTGALSAGGTQDPAETVVEQVWDNAGSDGVYDETDDRLEANLRPPAGKTVYLEVVVTDGDAPGGERLVDDVLVHDDGTIETDVDEDERPDEVTTADRPISVDHAGTPPGDVDSGTLRVEVW
ncbi:DUF7285 family protein [Natronolimnohabitans innermongolicus]|uniref:Uncharacterized protein n=1 Tax=Natronolimnohabitans innermongolicus JCM 12255 TaxID=1227499 RepID=L9X4R7_9EURY|nr:hypothetical protein [Natronolimnohabitans innermongolicus]ELY56700.1 hypothetical protein C493_10010 [Natronolimnohabitans innermongolicus JCM 12255]